MVSMLSIKLASAHLHHQLLFLVVSIFRILSLSYLCFYSCPLNLNLTFLLTLVPEDNVERLRNIRDMFEHPETDEMQLTHDVKRVQPSEKLLERLQR